METKNKQITLLQGKALLIELPDGVSNPRIWPESPDRLYVDDPIGYDGVDQIDLRPGNWRIIGMLSEVREEQAASIAEQVRVMNQRTKGYRTYKEDLYGNEGYYGSALKSLESAIEAEGYLLESPPTPKCGCFGPAEEGACPACDEWVESQSRVLDRSRCLLLGREG